MRYTSKATTFNAFIVSIGKGHQTLQFILIFPFQKKLLEKVIQQFEKNKKLLSPSQYNAIRNHFTFT